MPDFGILNVCSIAFLAVFILLAFLAGVMRLITLAFPALAIGADAAVIAAISTVVATVYPGARVINVEEES